MYKFCIFAGTTEGRKLVEFLATQPVSVTACVATEYGEALLPSGDSLTVSVKRLPAAEIARMLTQDSFDLVIDATHPYAVNATENISAACQAAGVEYLRLLRQDSNACPDAVYFANAEDAAAFLEKTEGNILLTTGSKNLEVFAALPRFSERFYARVLPSESSLTACLAAGLPHSHIIAMQGPFSQEMNLAILHSVSAAWLVTKDGGTVGGFAEKIAAAHKAGVQAVVIGRPPQKDGLSLSETVQLLCTRFGCTRQPHISVLGIGPGGPETMTLEVRQALRQADCLIGAQRMLEAADLPQQPVYQATSPEAIRSYIQAHPEYGRFAVVMSGDTGFFSGTKRLLPLLHGYEVAILPGISSLSYLCARLNTSYEDVFVISLHGRKHDIVSAIRSHQRVFALLGGTDGVNELCHVLEDAGLGAVKLTIGSRLGYPDEKISCGTVSGLASAPYPSLSVALIENDHPGLVVTPGLPDALFQRNTGSTAAVPMTKSEVRAVCLSKLRLTEYAVCWDIGAGTGSVAVEMARLAKKGSVYAVERSSAALALLRSNQQHFSAENLTIVDGCAPEACASLPTPSHAFIGGSAGQIRGILTLLLQKNPNIRIVATAISLESITELTSCIRSFPFTETEVVSIQVSHGKPAGDYHLMRAQNPIYIFTMQAGGTQP